jgi:hypothetical protein
MGRRTKNKKLFSALYRKKLISRMREECSREKHFTLFTTNGIIEV